MSIIAKVAAEPEAMAIPLGWERHASQPSLQAPELSGSLSTDTWMPPRSTPAKLETKNPLMPKCPVFPWGRLIIAQSEQGSSKRSIELDTWSPISGSRDCKASGDDFLVQAMQRWVCVQYPAVKGKRDFCRFFKATTPWKFCVKSQTLLGDKGLNLVS